MMLDFRKCFKCGGKTNTYRHPKAKIWCVECGYVNREEGGDMRMFVLQSGMGKSLLNAIGSGK